jgi:hypothetical protein
MTAEQAPTLLDSTDLENGLKIEFYDASRVIAGDRMQANLLIKILLKAEPSHFADCKEAERAFQAFVRSFGREIAFEQRKVRNFVDRNRVPAVLQELQEDFLRANQSYLSREHFEKRTILRKYQELLERRSYGQT